MPWRTAQLQFEMTPQPNITQTLADRRPHAHAEAAAARLGLRSRRQAYLGRHPATASLNIACWNVRSLSVDNAAKRSENLNSELGETTALGKDVQFIMFVRHRAPEDYVEHFFSCCPLAKHATRKDMVEKVDSFTK